MSQNDDYEVGYRKPPKASRWRKGQSGNQRGRQKGVPNLKTELTEELSEMDPTLIKSPALKVTPLSRSHRTALSVCSSSSDR